MKIEFVASAGAAEVLAVLVHEGRVLSGMGSQLDTATSGALTKAMTANTPIQRDSSQSSR